MDASGSAAAATAAAASDESEGTVYLGNIEAVGQDIAHLMAAQDAACWGVMAKRYRQLGRRFRALACLQNALRIPSMSRDMRGILLLEAADVCRQLNLARECVFYAKTVIQLLKPSGGATNQTQSSSGGGGGGGETIAEEDAAAAAAAAAGDDSQQQQQQPPAPQESEEQQLRRSVRRSDACHHARLLLASLAWMVDDKQVTGARSACACTCHMRMHGACTCLCVSISFRALWASTQAGGLPLACLSFSLPV